MYDGKELGGPERNQNRMEEEQKGIKKGRRRNRRGL